MLDLIWKFLESDYTDIILVYFIQLSPFLPLAYALPQYKKLTIELRVLTAYLILSILFSFITMLMAKYYLNNLNVINLFTWLETFTFCFVFGKWLNSKIAFRLSMFTFICFSIHSIYYFRLYEYNSKMEAFEGIIGVCMGSYLLFKKSMNAREVIYKDFHFWFIAPSIIMLGVNIVTMGLRNLLLNTHETLGLLLSTLYSLSVIFTHCLFTYGFICYRRKMNSFWSSSPSAE